MTNGGYILSNFVGGAIGGAIGAGVSQDSDSPILKGAVVTGLISAALGAVFVAVASAPAPKIGTSGLGQLQEEWRL
jgi:hypothetical protein